MKIKIFCSTIILLFLSFSNTFSQSRAQEVYDTFSGDKIVWKQGYLDINVLQYSSTARTTANGTVDPNGQYTSIYKYFIGFNSQPSSKYNGWGWIDNPFSGPVTKDIFTLPFYPNPNKLDPLIGRLYVPAGSMEASNTKPFNQYYIYIYKITTLQEIRNGKYWEVDGGFITATPDLIMEDYKWNPGPINTVSLTGGNVNLRDYLIGKGGSISGPGVTNDVFSPSAVGVGSYTIKAEKGGFWNGSPTPYNAVTTFVINVCQPPEAPTTSASSQSVCNGSGVTLTATGSGIVWNDGVTGNSRTVSTAGSYYATQSNSCGTSGISNVISITNGNTPAAPTIGASGTTALCNGSGVTLTANGSNVVWNDGVTGNSRTVTAAGSYFATQSNSCGTSSNSNIINVTTGSTPGAPTISANGATALCNGATVTLSSTGTGVVWNDGVTGNSRIISAAGTYYTTQSNSCGTSVNSNAITVTVGATPGAPGITVYGTTALCNGATVNLYADGTSIVWNDGISGNSRTISAAGTYYATQTNYCGTSIASVPVIITNVTTPAAPTVTASGATSLCNGATVTLTATGAGVVWMDGYTGNSRTVSTAGTYYATQSNSCGKSDFSNTIVTTTSSVPSIAKISGNGQLCNGSSSTLTARSTGATYYEWYKDGNYYSGGTSSTISVSTAGDYRVATSNICGATPFSDIFSVSSDSTPSTPTLTTESNTLCNGASTTLTASASIRSRMYSWYKDGKPLKTTEEPTITVTEAGNYSVAGLNVCGISLKSAVVSIATMITPGKPSLTAGATLLCNKASTTLSATSSGSSIFNWYKNGILFLSKGGQVITITEEGNYTAIEVSVCGNSIESDPIIIQTSNSPDAPVLSANGAVDLCNGATVILTSTGSNVVWNDGYKGNTRTISTAGSYYTTQTNSCATSINSNIIKVTTANTVTPKITASATIIFTNETINFISDVSGKNEWFKDGVSMGVLNELFTTKDPGIYKSRSITTNGCISEFSNEIKITRYSEPTNPPVIIPPTDPGVIVEPQPDGSTKVSFCMGRTEKFTAPLADSYQWFKNGVAIPGATSRILNINSAGDYTVKIWVSGNTFTTPLLKVTLFELPKTPSIIYVD